MYRSHWSRGSARPLKANSVVDHCLSCVPERRQAGRSALKSAYTLSSAWAETRSQRLAARVDGTCLQAVVPFMEGFVVARINDPQHTLPASVNALHLLQGDVCGDRASRHSRARMQREPEQRAPLSAGIKAHSSGRPKSRAGPPRPRRRIAASRRSCAPSPVTGRGS